MAAQLLVVLPLLLMLETMHWRSSTVLLTVMVGVAAVERRWRESLHLAQGLMAKEDDANRAKARMALLLLLVQRQK